MPFIHIKSLPFEDEFDLPKAIISISRDFAEKNALPLFHVHVTWEFYLPGHYAKGDEAPDWHPTDYHPVIIDLLTPDFNSEAVIENMLNSLASSVVSHTHININRIFINHRRAHSGMVFDDGKIVKW